MTGLTLGEREVHALRDMVDTGHHDDPGPALPWSVLDAVGALLGADDVELEQTWPGTGKLGFLQARAGQVYLDEEDDDPHFWMLFWASPGGACSYALRTGDLAAVVKVSDFVSGRQWRSSGMYADYVRPCGMVHEMGTHLPASDGTSLRLHVWRGPGRDFGEKERFLLTLLRPHLIGAYHQAERARRGPVGLTPRQLEILGYVERGLTNGQVARRMQLSEGTVRRHLNNIYERLGVTSRTAAVSRVAASRA